jgi:hypothetical protein
MHPSTGFYGVTSGQCKTVKVSIVHLQSIVLSETSYGKNAEGADNGHVSYQFMSFF